jgi:hypothetical protein
MALAPVFGVDLPSLGIKDLQYTGALPGLLR